MKCPTCGTDILEHLAGRCLDAWVAERVIGAKIASYIQNGVDVKAELYPDNTMRILRSYSTSIADAWEVAEKKRLSLISLEDKFFCGFYDLNYEYLDTEAGVIDGHFGGGYTGMDNIYCVADTATLAICRAAILAMEAV